MIIRFSARNRGSVRQRAPQLLVLLGRGAARGGALDRLGLDRAVRPRPGDQRVPLRRRAEQPAPRAVDVVLEEAGVRRRVELAQPQVRRHRVELALRVEPVGQVDLVAVAGVQVLLDLRRRRRRRRAGAVSPGNRGSSTIWRAKFPPRSSGFPGYPGNPRTGGRTAARGSAASRRRRVRRRRRPAPGGRAGRRSRSSRTTGRGGSRRRARPPARRRRPTPRPRTRRPTCRVTSRRGGRVGQRDVVRLQDADQRTVARPLAGAAAVEPEAALVRGGRPRGTRRRRSRPGGPRPGSSPRSSHHRGAVLGQDRLGVELHALLRQRDVPHPHHHVAAGVGGGDHQRRRAGPARPASGSAPPRRAAAGRRRPRRRRAGSARPTPCAGSTRSTRAAVRRHQALHARGRPRAPAGVPASSTSRPTAKSAASTGVPGPGDSTTCECRSTSSGVDLVVLHDGRQHPGHRGDEVHEVPRVGVVVVDHHDVRDHEVKIGGPRPSAHDAVHLELVGQLDQVGARARREAGPRPAGRASRPGSR